MNVMKHKKREHEITSEERNKEEEKECDQCGKCFTRSSDLKQHELSHSEPQFECDTCSKWFKSRKGFIKHQKIFHSDRIKSMLEIELNHE